MSDPDPLPANPRSSMPQLSVVVTVYRETYSIVETVERLLGSNGPALGEILLIASPHSPAATMQICEDLVRTYPIVTFYLQKSPGVGRAVREGMSLAKYDCVAIMSSDLETEPEA